MKQDLAPELRQLVKWSVALLGNIIETELGTKAYQRIELTRRRMAAIRKASPERVSKELERTFQELKKLKPIERLHFARAYTLMLEIMNACENAFRTHRLQLTSRTEENPPKRLESIYFVLTAHPTEARSPDNISIFHEIQKELVQALHSGPKRSQEKLRSLLILAWNIPIVRHRKPRVEDEAEHIYSILLRDSNLSLLLDLSASELPVYIRSWVGGDKDGHTGVDHRTLVGSLQLSRNLLLHYSHLQLQNLRELLHPFKGSAGKNFPLANPNFQLEIQRFERALNAVRKIRTGDGRRVRAIHQALAGLLKAYQKVFENSLPAPLQRLDAMISNFPGFVVPLELREDSSVLMSDPTGDTLTIGKMMKRIGELAGGANPCWYARGMIISMAETVEHLETTVRMLKRQIGNHQIPVVPLFEQSAALKKGDSVVEAFLKNRRNHAIVKKDWNATFEVMLGYSDSSKEAGVLPSRLAVNDAMVKLDRVCRKYKIRPVFFHGSGGSVDRGGGSVSDQMSGWPDSALRTYKATVQGEMVDRIFSSPEILESQLLKIMESASKPKPIFLSPALEEFAARIKLHYQAAVGSTEFLRVVELATPYPYLSALKIGSRPTKRSKKPGGLSVNALRAIPWVLCWTQTRVLFPTWWGVGSSWRSLSPAEKQELKTHVFKEHGTFRSYVHALGFTLAKIELPVFEFYLKQSTLSEKQKTVFRDAFRAELALTRKFFREITGERDLLWFRPWLGKSIELRASMIHPLNLLEIIAQKEKDLPLLRVSVTGISSGMLTTG